MNLYALLAPLEWVVANIMVLFHMGLTFVGMDPAAGITWALSIIGLTITVRMLLIPVFVRQIKAQRAMQVIAPDLRKIQDKYKNKKDQASREAMTRETMELYSKHKTNPFASCLPLLLQMPIFFALFHTLNVRLKDPSLTIGLLSSDLIKQASDATIFGAKLSESFTTSESISAKVIAVVLIVLMVATSFFSQRQLTMKNMPASALEGPMAQQQKILMYVMPFTFVFSGPFFPIGVVLYWSVSNLWSMGQQFYVIRNNPTPGSEAEARMIERKTAKMAAKGLALDGRPLDVVRAEEEAAALAAIEEKRNRQRNQPKGKKRAKGAAMPASAEPSKQTGDELGAEDDDAADQDPPGISTK